MSGSSTLCITQLKAEGPSRTCKESKEAEEEVFDVGDLEEEEEASRSPTSNACLTGQSPWPRSLAASRSVISKLFHRKC